MMLKCFVKELLATCIDGESVAEKESPLDQPAGEGSF
jgi:hypothetical protein